MWSLVFDYLIKLYFLVLTAIKNKFFFFKIFLFYTLKSLRLLYLILQFHLNFTLLTLGSEEILYCRKYIPKCERNFKKIGSIEEGQNSIVKFYPSKR